MAKVNGNSARDAVDSAAEATHDAVDRVSATARKGADAVSDRANQVVDDAADAVHTTVNAARDSITAQTQKATANANDLSGKAMEVAKKYPLRVVLIVAALAAVGGFIAGAVRRR